jgi:hypothetical protein
MSFLRIRSPFHEPRDIPLGPSASHHSSKGIRGATFDNPVVGAYASGESNRSKANRQTREYKEREAAAARARRAAR